MQIIGNPFSFVFNFLQFLNFIPSDGFIEPAQVEVGNQDHGCKQHKRRQQQEKNFSD
jgi:hypothetical protein